MVTVATTVFSNYAIQRYYVAKKGQCPHKLQCFTYFVSSY